MLRFVPRSVVWLLTLAAFSTGALFSRALADLTLYGTAFSSDRLESGQNYSILYNINPTNGVATPIGTGIGYRLVGGIAFDSAGTLYGVGETLTSGPGPVAVGDLVLLTINTSTGYGSIVGSGLGVQRNFQDISFRNSDGALYAYASGEVYTISKSSGLATLVGSTGEAEIGGGLAFSNTDTLYKAGWDHLNSINQTSGSAGALLQLSYPNPNAPNPNLDTPNVTGMDYEYYSSPTGVLWAAVHTSADDYSPAYLATIDTGTGLITKIGDSIQGLTGLAAIPEPSNFGFLAGVGLVAIGMMSRVRRRTTAEA